MRIVTKFLLSLAVLVTALSITTSCQKSTSGSGSDNDELVGTSWVYSKGDEYGTTYTSSFLADGKWEEIAKNSIASTKSTGTYKYSKPTITIDGVDGLGRKLDTITGTMASDGNSFTTNEGWKYVKVQ